MVAVVVWRENGVWRVVAFQHAGRMGNPDQEHGILVSFTRSSLDRRTGMLLQDVIDMLNTSWITAFDAVHPFIEPADGGPKRDAVGAHLAFLLEALQRVPNCV